MTTLTLRCEHAGTKSRPEASTRRLGYTHGDGLLEVLDHGFGGFGRPAPRCGTRWLHGLTVWLTRTHAWATSHVAAHWASSGRTTDPNPTVTGPHSCLTHLSAFPWVDVTCGRRRPLGWCFAVIVTNRMHPKARRRVTRAGGHPLQAMALALAWSFCYWPAMTCAPSDAVPTYLTTLRPLCARTYMQHMSNFASARGVMRFRHLTFSRGDAPGSPPHGSQYADNAVPLAWSTWTLCGVARTLRATRAETHSRPPWRPTTPWTLGCRPASCCLLQDRCEAKDLAASRATAPWSAPQPMPPRDWLNVGSDRHVNMPGRLSPTRRNRATVTVARPLERTPARQRPCTPPCMLCAAQPASVYRGDRQPRLGAYCWLTAFCRHSRRPGYAPRETAYGLCHDRSTRETCPFWVETDIAWVQTTEPTTRHWCPQRPAV